jgi:zinc/manganese transport system permease protein
MMSLPFMRQAAVACVLLALVLAPLGTEVIRRRIVFVDLALAQIAALGAAIGTAAEWDPIATSVVVTVAGAGLLAVPGSSARLPQEAVMGVVYAVAAAAAVLVVAKASHGDADFLQLLFGTILAVTDRQLAILAGLAIAVAIWKTASRRADHAATGRGATVVFYLLLGLVIAGTIRSAGVLMVFTYLVAPALVIRLMNVARGAGVAAAGIAGSCGVVGLWASYQWDLPSGSAIVAVFGCCLAVAAIVARLASHRTPRGA